jgi:hypothetical protein
MDSRMRGNDSQIRLQRKENVMDTPIKAADYGTVSAGCREREAMSIPWWVYLVSLPMVLFGLGIHFLPVLVSRLAAQDARRAQELQAQRVTEESAEL